MNRTYSDKNTQYNRKDNGGYYLYRWIYKEEQRDESILVIPYESNCMAHINC